MDKLKKKNTASTQISYYWSLALLARHFEAEINADLEDVVQSLRDMKPLVRIDGHFYLRSRDKYQTDIQMIDDGLYTFEIKRLRYVGKGKYRSSVKTSGRIIYSEGYERTIIRGDVRLTTNFLLIIFMSFIFILAFISEPSLPSAFLAIVMTIGTVLAIVNWRDDLRERLQNTLDSVPRRETDPAQAGDILTLDPEQNENPPIEIDA